MIKKPFVAALLLVCCCITVFAQTKPRLGILPFAGGEGGDGESIATLFSFQRDIQGALQELEYQLSGYTAEDGAKALGRAANADYVLSAEVHSLGSLNMFTAQILHAEDGSLLDGDSRDYRTVADGIRLMPELARFLTDRIGEETRIREERERMELERKLRIAKSKFWSLGVSAGTSFADPWVIGTIRGTLAPLPYSFLEIGFDAGFISGSEWDSYYSLYPYANYAFFLPFPKKGGWYIGAGAGFRQNEYSVDDWSNTERAVLINVTTGFNIGNMFDISYTMQTSFISVNNKLSAGFVKRFN